MRKLTTEADGRALAIEMLHKADNTSLDDCCLFPHGRDVRGGRPQTNYVLQYLKRLRRADSEDVYRGFAAVLSDVCCTACESAGLPEFYEKEDRALGKAAALQAQGSGHA